MKNKKIKKIATKSPNKPHIFHTIEMLCDITDHDYIKALHTLTNIELDYEFFDRTYFFSSILNDDSIVSISIATYALELTDNAFKNKLVVCDEDAYDEVYASIREIYIDFLICEYLLYTENKYAA